MLWAWYSPVYMDQFCTITNHLFLFKLPLCSKVSDHSLVACSLISSACGMDTNFLGGFKSHKILTSHYFVWTMMPLSPDCGLHTLKPTCTIVCKIFTIYFSGCKNIFIISWRITHEDSMFLGLVIWNETMHVKKTWSMKLLKELAASGSLPHSY